MQESEPLRLAQRSDAPGSRQPAAPDAPPATSGNDPPTIRSGGSGSSGSRRRAAMAKLPEPGDRIDDFELDEAIGFGGMGAVFRARDTQLDRLVALKILPPDQAGDAETVQRFYQEGKSSARLDHENIARVYTIGHDAEYHYIAFEFIEGTTLRQRVERGGPLRIDEAINFTLQIAGALVHASERGVVHRDIKPSNIIVTPLGRAKLVDMGLARRFERDGRDEGLTQSGMTLGTFDYISPEQARDPRDVDVRSDLYSLGCTLFHMLTGRPPFPDGTVLQKLLQHQEEPPPEIRALNPEVPPDLAAILAKLLAKDRDRRYQTPEQLVRDLLTVAGTLGLRSLSPEGLVWMTATTPPSWERHLFWGIPALALVVVVIGLVWWGQEPATSATPFSPETAETVFPKADPSVPAQGRPEAPRTTAPPREQAPEPAATTASSGQPRPIEVKATGYLLAAIADAPAGATLILVDEGPYDLVPELVDGSSPPVLARKDLTIKAGPKTRPIVRWAEEAPAPAGDAALLHFVGGRVTLDGLTLELGPQGLESSSVALRADGTELTLRRCLFRRPVRSGEGGRVAALEVEAAPRNGARSPLVRVESCHFDGGQAGVLARGPAEILLSDCTFGAAEPTIWLPNPEGSAVVARLWLSHVSILAGDGAVFRFAGTEARVRVDDSVVAPAGEGRAILVATDAPDRLDWVGRDNLYAGVSTFLLPTRDPQDHPVVEEFDAWSDDPEGARETGSIARADHVWEEDDPDRALARDDLARAFRLRPAHRLSPASGARRGPFGPLIPPAEMIARATPPTGDSRWTGPAEAPETPEADPDAPDAIPEPMAVAAAPMARREDEPVSPSAPDRPDDPEEARGAEPAPDGPAANPSGEAPPKDAVDPVLIRTPRQFLDAWRGLGSKGGVIRLAADADLILPACEVAGSGRWEVEAQAGTSRPRLRFDPGWEATETWPSLFRVRSGSLHLRGVDIVLDEPEDTELERRAAFGLKAGAELGLIGCSVTVAGRERSAVVVVQPAEDEAEPGLAGPNPPVARIRVTESLLRGGGDLVDVAAGLPLDLDLTQAVVSTGGSLVHGHGLPRGQARIPLKVGLHRVSARVAGGLVQLESAVGEPELPVAEVVARDTILATSLQGGPLFRIDGQDALESLRDQIHWDGRAVAYHQIDTYRLDQVAQPGTVPLRFDRPSWEIAVGTREDVPIHGDLKFLKDWDPDRDPWTLTRDDVRLAPESPALGIGPDLQHIPNLPPA